MKNETNKPKDWGLLVYRWAWLVLLILLYGCAARKARHRPLKLTPPPEPTWTVPFRYPTNLPFVTQWDIESSTDLVYWTIAATNVTPNSPTNHDSDDPHFYRAVGRTR